MNKKIQSALAIAASTLFISQAVDARPLTIVSWGGSMEVAHKAANYDTFTAKTGNEIVSDSYNGGIAKVKAMVESKAVTWDLIQLEEPDLYQACEEGLLEPIDWSIAGDKSLFVDAAVHECGLATLAWSNVIAFNKDTLAKGPKSWADFWDVKKFPGKRGLRKIAVANLEFALMADGVATGDVYALLNTAAGVDRAFAKLEELKPHVQWWSAGAQPPEWLASGDVVMTSAYSGRIGSANREGKNFQIVWNGNVYTYDFWAVLKGSPNAKQAFEFIAHATSEKAALVFPTFIPYGIPNKAAMAKMPRKLARELPTFPANMKKGLNQGTEFWLDNQEELNERFNAMIAK